ncbi:MAG: hypothetical protein WBG41_10880 [Acidimicrobiales bacterium]
MPEAVAVVLVHPEPLVLILAFVSVAVFEPLYLPFMLPAFVGKAVIVQEGRTLDLNVAPAFGAPRVIFVLAMVAVQVPVVVIVSVPPDESVQPLMEGGDDSFMVSEAGLGTLPVTVKVVHVTVIGTESISPLKVRLVPDFRFPVTVVPAANDA